MITYSAENHDQVHDHLSLRAYKTWTVPFKAGHLINLLYTQLHNCRLPLTLFVCVCVYVSGLVFMYGCDEIFFILMVWLEYLEFECVDNTDNDLFDRGS